MTWYNSTIRIDVISNIMGDHGSLFDALMVVYINKIDELELDCVTNGLLVTDVNDFLLQTRGDIQAIRLSYIAKKYDEVFDLIVGVNNKLAVIDEIVYPDLLEI